MFDELIEIIDSARIKNPELECEVWYNMAVKHIKENVELWIKYNHPLGKNDYQE